MKSVRMIFYIEMESIKVIPRGTATFDIVVCNFREFINAIMLMLSKRKEKRNDRGRKKKGGKKSKLQFYR